MWVSPLGRPDILHSREVTLPPIIHRSGDQPATLKMAIESVHKRAVRTEGDLPRMPDSVSQGVDDSCGSTSDLTGADDDSDLAIGRRAFAPRMPPPTLPLPVSFVACRPSRYQHLRERRRRSLKLSSDQQDIKSPLEATVHSRTLGQPGGCLSPLEISSRDGKGVQQEACKEVATSLPTAFHSACDPIEEADVAGTGAKLGAPTSPRSKALPTLLRQVRVRQMHGYPAETDVSSPA